MPIYEYKCQKCGHKFEKLVFGEEEIKCPECNSRRIEKLFPSSIGIGKKGNNDSRGCSTGTCPLRK
jgi:putative FmdB family regulatory protein